MNPLVNASHPSTSRARSERAPQRWLGAVLGLLLPLAALAQAPAPGSAEELALGRRIYNEGMLSAGTELTGMRLGHAAVPGAPVACVNCHRRSGMGQVEADILVPPITGNFLYAEPNEKRIATMDPRVSKLFNQAHEPYTDAMLEAAIRDGLNSEGREMSAAMPRYRLSKPELKAVTAYLKQLSAQWSPGVSQTSIRFATVITPDADAARRQVMVSMMRTIFRQKNGSTVTAKQSRTRHHMISAAEMVLGTERNWELDIWELKGEPATWGEQLSALYRKQPVFALVSGLSNSSWQPVQDFCEQQQVPCWFPSVAVPGTSRSHYGLYFSGGVTLEAAALARHLTSQQLRPEHVLQIYREGDAGRAASQALSQGLADSGIKVSDRVLRNDLTPADALRAALARMEPHDAAVFWLRAEDIQALHDVKPIAGKSYFSGLLAGGEHAPLPAAWRARSALVYPYELPASRTKNLDYFHAWLNISKLPLVDEAMQSEVFFALSFLTDTLADMLDNIYRDYLVERAETMLSVREGVKSEQETRDRLALGREGDMLKRYGASTIDAGARVPISNQAAKSQGTTLYPRLSLGPDQRFASKGAYIVRFTGGSGVQLTAESEWIVP